MWQYSYSYIWSTGFALGHHTHGEGAKRIMLELTCNEEGRHTLARYCYVKVKYMYMEIPIVTHTESYHDGQVQCRGETMTITFHAGRHSGSLDTELEHDEY